MNKGRDDISATAANTNMSIGITLATENVLITNVRGNAHCTREMEKIA